MNTFIVNCIFAVYVHMFCNLTGLWKFLNRETHWMCTIFRTLSFFLSIGGDGMRDHSRWWRQREPVEAVFNWHANKLVCSMNFITTLFSSVSVDIGLSCNNNIICYCAFIGSSYRDRQTILVTLSQFSARTKPSLQTSPTKCKYSRSRLAIK